MYTEVNGIKPKPELFWSTKSTVFRTSSLDFSAAFLHTGIFTCQIILLLKHNVSSSCNCGKSSGEVETRRIFPRNIKAGLK